MTQIQFNQQAVQLYDGESVLDGLLRHGFDIPHGCKSGVCQSCMLKVEDGALPPRAQLGLKATQKSQGYFLSCSCVPLGPDLRISNDENCFQKTTAVIEKISLLNSSVFLLKLRVHNFSFIPGQYITLWKNESCARCYSIASAEQDAESIELHIKLIPEGQFSAWVFHHLAPGDTIDISGPAGECFYTSEDKQAPLLLAGISTGLAPLYGILRHAINEEHEGPMHLVCGAQHTSGLYLIEELRELEKRTHNLKVDFIAQRTDSKPGIIEGDIYQHLKQSHPSTKGYKAYLCGAASFVHKLKKQIFLAGANSQNIYADVFKPFTC